MAAALLVRGSVSHDPLLSSQARVMATIGVTRGLGDHDLKVHDSNIYIKPFLSSAPEVLFSFLFCTIKYFLTLFLL